MSDSESDASSGDSDEADGHAYVFAPLQAWISMIRLFRAKFRRGINLSHLRSAFSAAGVTPSSVQGPSSTRMVVYSSRFLRQSFSHYRIRWSAVLRAWGHARGCGARRPSAADKRNIAVISTSVRVLAFNLFGLANKVLPPKCAEMSSCLIRVQFRSVRLLRHACCKSSYDARRHIQFRGSAQCQSGPHVMRVYLCSARLLRHACSKGSYDARSHIQLRGSAQCLSGPHVYFVRAARLF